MSTFAFAKTPSHSEWVNERLMPKTVSSHPTQRMRQAGNKLQNASIWRQALIPSSTKTTLILNVHRGETGQSTKWWFECEIHLKIWASMILEIRHVTFSPKREDFLVENWCEGSDRVKLYLNVGFRPALAIGKPHSNMHYCTLHWLAVTATRLECWMECKARW